MEYPLAVCGRIFFQKFDDVIEFCAKVIQNKSYAIQSASHIIDKSEGRNLLFSRDSGLRWISVDLQ